MTETRGSRPHHKKCGMALARMYYTMYSQDSRGSKSIPLADWMWCVKCGMPVHMVQCDLEMPAGMSAGKGWRRRK